MNVLWLLCLVLTVDGEKTPVTRLIAGKWRDVQLFDSNSSASDIALNRMSPENSIFLRFVLDYSSRSNWNSIVFFFTNSSESYRILTPIIFNHFNSEGRFVAVHLTSFPLLPRSVLHQRHRLGIVYYCDVLDEDFLWKMSEYDLFDPYRSWLMVRPESKKCKRLEEVLKGLSIKLTTNLVLATMNKRTAVLTTRKPTASTTAATMTTTSSEFLVGYRKREICPRLKRELTGDPNVVVHLVQIYKVSETENETMSVQLGYWDVPNGLLKTQPPVLPEQRWNLGGYKISVGVKNSSSEVPTGGLAFNQFALDSQIEEESKFMELFDCLMYGINARYKQSKPLCSPTRSNKHARRRSDRSQASQRIFIKFPNTSWRFHKLASFDLVQFQKLGWRNEDGGWTHLLGAVVDGTVDFALETLNPNVDKSQDMSFTYAIIITMNNVYFRRPTSGGLRDIFLAPFSSPLLLCVLGTGFLLALAMILIAVAHYWVIESKESGSNFEIVTRKRRERSVIVTSKPDQKIEVSDAALWTISVLCMQGSQWSPNSFSGSLLLINSLLFALIIYNSFAAFITSVLSVKDVRIKDLKDLAGSDFAFGYTLGNADELFLRTVNNTLLRELYFKGLKDNDGVTDPIIGMHRAAKGKYALFVKARTARRALRTVVEHDKRCEFQELYLPVTKNFASIPMTRKSSLRKILNYKIIRLMESGILQRLQTLILLSMPRCVEKSTFNSARITDVYSAFFVLGVGQVSSLFILLVEIIWHKRKKMEAKAKFIQNWRQRGFKTRERFFWLK